MRLILTWRSEVANPCRADTSHVRVAPHLSKTPPINQALQIFNTYTFWRRPERLLSLQTTTTILKRWTLFRNSLKAP